MANTQEIAPDPKTDAGELKIAKNFKIQVDDSKTYASKFHRTWKGNVEQRIGKTPMLGEYGQVTTNEGITATGGELQTVINPDWSLTKTKTANLFSQVPAVQGTHENEAYAAAVPLFVKDLNYELGEKRTHVATAMQECLNDVVNASGIACMVVGYTARFEKVEMPTEPNFNGPQGPIPYSAMPPEVLQKVLAMSKEMGQPIQTEEVDRPTDYRFYMSRISPIDLRWPKSFVGSNYDDADWVGQRGRCSWAEAKLDFKLSDIDKDRLLEASRTQQHDSLRVDDDVTNSEDALVIEYDEIFYWRARIDADEKCLTCIYRLVWVDGLDKPVVHEQWKGQEFDKQSGKYVGCSRFPIRVLTLTYISDNAVPPSDSEAGRPQVLDMRRSRAQYFETRRRSMPGRWYDVNRIGAQAKETLARGEIGFWLPTNGPGDKAIGEIARGAYAPENFEFDRMSQADLNQSWQISAEQTGATPTGRRTAAESNNAAAGFNTRIGQERNMVSAFFLSAVEVLAGWMVLYSDFPSLTPQQRMQMEQAWDRKKITHDLVLSIRPDSTIVLEPQARIDKIAKFMNLTVQSGYVNPKPLIVEMAELSGIDPSTVVIDPSPKPEKVQTSLRLTGKDDLSNVAVMAMLVHAGEAPSPDELHTAAQILKTVQDLGFMAADPSNPLMQPQGGPGGQQQQGPGPQAPRPGEEPPHADWQLAPKIAARAEDIGKEK